jgi:2,3-bisphosphoglycerate-dependent phosphoglycerate mutase
LPAVTGTLVLLRHGESEWNAKGLFTGWVDVDLTDKGEEEARRGGVLLKGHDLLPTVLHTSLLTRAIRTSTLALEACGRDWIPVRRSWRLNERHYGDLQGKGKADTLKEYGEEKFMLWRRSYATPPPMIKPDNAYDVSDDPRYADLARDVLPRTECLADVVVRMLPYWYDAIVPDLRAGGVVLVGAHGNSLRALVKHLDGLSEEAVVGLDIPTGIPLRYDLDEDLRVVDKGYLDPAAAATASAAVAAQGRG